MKIFKVAFLAVCFFTACNSDSSQTEGKTIEEIQSEGKISSIIRNPVSADAPIDTINVAKMSFDSDTYNFGTVDEGDIVKHSYEFTNNGKVPLLISNARSSCGCTIPDWPREPIEPGDSRQISVKFDTKDKPRDQTKTITITANTYPSTTKLFLTGYVNPKTLKEKKAERVNN